MPYTAMRHGVKGEKKQKKVHPEYYSKILGKLRFKGIWENVTKRISAQPTWEVRSQYRTLVMVKMD